MEGLRLEVCGLRGLALVMGGNGLSRSGGNLGLRVPGLSLIGVRGSVVTQLTPQRSKPWG